MQPALPSTTRIILALTLTGLTLLPLTGCRRSDNGNPSASSTEPAQDFAHWMNVGKNYYDRGEAKRAIDPFTQATQLNPTDADAQLNLANALLLSEDTTNALDHAQRAITLDRNLAAAYYVAGCSLKRMGQFEEALKMLQQAKDLAPKVGATTFQLASAHQELGHFEDAAAAYQELLGFEPNHPTAWYTLSQCLIRNNQPEAAQDALEKHRALQAQGLQPGQKPMDVARLERCIHTDARAPFIIEQPPAQGIPVTFTDVSASTLPQDLPCQAPFAFLDIHTDGHNSLFVTTPNGFQLLLNDGTRFMPQGNPVPLNTNATYFNCLVADLQNDRYPDALMIGDQGIHAFRFATNGRITDVTTFSRLGKVPAKNGSLIDIDFTGKLDLLAINPTNASVQVMRNLGSMYFKDVTATSGIPSSIQSATSIAVEDWNNDDQLDVIIAQNDAPPALLLKERGGPLTLTNSPTHWPNGSVIAVADFNNDLLGDLAIATPNGIQIVLNKTTNHIALTSQPTPTQTLYPFDYDNDGWLDLLVAGPGLRAFRNLGSNGFTETTDTLQLNTLSNLNINAIASADIDIDGDSDLVIHASGSGLKVLRNDGGNANLQVKVQLYGNRSNASGLGSRIEITAGQLRIGRRVNQLPIEIGVGSHKILESLNARWLNLDLNNVDVEVNPTAALPLWELTLPEGSCPYLYAWDGTRFRFVTDLLGSAPLGLRVAENFFVEADPDEYVWLGNSSQLQPRNGAYELRITEELREVLYLDTAALVAVDHPPGTEVYTTGKMVPSKPFPPHELITLKPLGPLLHAERNDGLDVTQALREIDQHHASPIHPRIPQLRGLAEPWSITLDFGPLPTDRPLALGITAWLRFGGGMANVAASQNPDLPFPFPTLEVETQPNQWQPVDLVFGTPAGKTKNLIVDLTGKLPPKCHRLRITTAYELHWDRIALMEKTGETSTHITRLTPDTANLRYRGFSRFEDKPWTQPLTPAYDQVSLNPAWRITPAGWCTRYGDVLPLIQDRDNALALLNGGDEVVLRFEASKLPPTPPTLQRTFFLFSTGWDKDSDFHCEKGWEVAPLPWHGLSDQRYGQEPRPSFENDEWIEAYNTRYVGPWILSRPSN
ncbi:MAG: FG-GAP-like repeat-containing protein [Limisphaerales bacterium]